MSHGIWLMYLTISLDEKRPLTIFLEDAVSTKNWSDVGRDGDGRRRTGIEVAHVVFLGCVRHVRVRLRERGSLLGQKGAGRGDIPERCEDNASSSSVGVLQLWISSNDERRNLSSVCLNQRSLYVSI